MNDFDNAKLYIQYIKQQNELEDLHKGKWGIICDENEPIEFANDEESAIDIAYDKSIKYNSRSLIFKVGDSLSSEFKSKVDFFERKTYNEIQMKWTECYDKLIEQNQLNSSNNELIQYFILLMIEKKFSSIPETIIWQDNYWSINWYKKNLFISLEKEFEITFYPGPLTICYLTMEELVNHLSNNFFYYFEYTQ